MTKSKYVEMMGVDEQLRRGSGGERPLVATGTHCANGHHTATANTLTTQYMVRFSHRTVELPAGVK